MLFSQQLCGGLRTYKKTKKTSRRARNAELPVRPFVSVECLKLFSPRSLPGPRFHKVSVSPGMTFCRQSVRKINDHQSNHTQREARGVERHPKWHGGPTILAVQEARGLVAKRVPQMEWEGH